ncbi:MAG: TIGR04150 pseudo-rSAM protein [Firmicutes bacterium]|nr:TIGR04150 pseudo-rSAM protein [Bacillota bacterium]
MKEYWFYLNKDTFLWYNDDIVIVYNTLNGRLIESKICKSLQSICKELCIPKNLYCIKLDQNIISNNNVANWIDKIIKSDAGNLIENYDGILKPVSFMPILKLNDDINVIRYRKTNHLEDKVIEFLHELTFHINGNISFPEYAQQIQYPLNSSNKLTFQQIAKFIYGCLDGIISTINIIGDFSKYPMVDFDLLLQFLQRMDCVTNYLFTTRSLSENIKILKKIPLNFNKTIIVDDIKTLALDIEHLTQISDSLTYQFLITKEEDIEQADFLIRKYNINFWKYLPVYTGKNLAFFEEIVYISHDDFDSANLSKHTIFSHQMVNTNFFGKLIITPEGNVFANLNKPPLGNISDSIHDIIYKEIDSEAAWRLVRDCIQPCRSCIYKLLCPSISNYELVIGRNNLCHVNNA